MIQHTNETCTQRVPNEMWESAVTVEDGINSFEPCGKPVRYERGIRINTPYCKEHSRDG